MTKSKSAAKLPQGRVLFCEDASLIETTNPLGALCSDRIMGTETPVLVLPMPTIAVAKKRLRWERMTEGQKLAAFQSALGNAGDWSYGNKPTIEELSTAILSLIQP